MEFTDIDGAKCNLISAGINHPALFFGAPSILSNTSSKGGAQCHKNGGGRRGGQPNTSVKDYENKINCSFFSSGVHFFFATVMPAPEHIS